MLTKIVSTQMCQPAFNTPPPYLSDLSSTPAQPACESQHSDRIDPGPDSSAGEDREDPGDPKEKEAGEEEDEGEETEDVGERDESQTPPLYSTKRRPLSPAKEKSCVRRRTKRRRFSSPFSLDEETEMGDESDISSYKPHHVLDSRPTPSPRPTWGEIQATMVQGNFRAVDPIDARELEWRSSTSGRVGKERLSMRGMRSKGAEGPASNISYDGSSPGWTVLVSGPQNCCKIGGERRLQVVGVDPRAPSDRLLPVFFWPGRHTEAYPPFAVSWPPPKIMVTQDECELFSCI